MNQTTKAALIGAVGGFALSLLKLIDAGFFLSVSGPSVLAAYLTYASYVLLGGITAAFLSDFDLPYPKLRRLAFTIGIGAPGLLIALAQQPVKQEMPSSQTASEPPIRTLLLEYIPLGTAHAQAAASAPVGTPTKGSDTVAGVVTLKRGDLTASFEDGFKAAIGRGQIETPYVFVLGSTNDPKKATHTAESLTSFFNSSSTARLPATQAKVVKVEGQDRYFVIVGDIDDRQSLNRLRSQSKSAALDALAKAGQSTPGANSELARIADLISKAPVVPAINLAK